MENNTRTTTPPTFTGGCSCIGRCKCCDAPKRICRHAPNNENVRGIDLFNHPGPFPDIECPGTPPSNTRKTCPGAPEKNGRKL